MAPNQFSVPANSLFAFELNLASFSNFSVLTFNEDGSNPPVTVSVAFDGGSFNPITVTSTATPIDIPSGTKALTISPNDGNPAGSTFSLFFQSN